MARTPPEIQQAAQTLLAWAENLNDPRVAAFAQAQAHEDAMKAAHAGGCPAAVQRAFILRFLESLARDNAGLMDKLTGEAGDA